jgi:dTDP-4-amino-4,6-dideoxygalactose transaminase
LEKFEKQFAEYVGVKYCIGVASGTDALHLSLRALGIGPGDEVLIPANTFVATAYAILYVNAKPVLIDINPNTYNIDVTLIEQKITKKTKAIIPVHLYGQPAEMDTISKMAKKYGLSIIEDACQAHGASYRKKQTGNLGTLGTFSFYVSKNLGAFGDGGAITTNSATLAKKLKRLREYGETSRYSYEEVGFNSRLDAVQAAILSVKLKHLDKWNSQRQQIARYYNKRFRAELPSIITPSTENISSHVYHLYVIQTQKRNKLLKYLAEKGIQAAIHYPIPLHLQHSLQSLKYKQGDFPITEKIAGEILSLPMYPQLSKKQQDYIVESVSSFFKS